MPSLAVEMPCPRCGYDLRATPSEGGRRCPECGTVSQAGARSRLPWVHRRYRGVVRGFFATMWLVMWRPKELAREEWINRRQARAFHRWALLLASMIGAGMLMAVFAVRGDEWRNRLDVGGILQWESLPAGGNVLPMYALSDSFWVAVPVFLAVYVWLDLSLGLLRGIVRQIGADVRRRERAGRAGYYASGLAPINVLVWGIVAVGGMLLDSKPTVLEPFEDALAVSTLVMGVIGLVIFVVPPLVLLRHLGQRGSVRNLIVPMLVFPVYPVVVAGLGVAVFVVVFWVVGYVIIAVWSMVQ